MSANKILFNTVILYIKILITTGISLFSVPLVLKSLGVDDYGIYNLIVGVIGMLSFLNASMTISTQRFLSVAIGAKNENLLNEVYSNSVILHIIISIIVVFILEIGGLFLFDGFLNIEESRIGIAKSIYQFLVLSTCFTILSVPYNAIINSKEDMLAFSIIGIIEALAKLAIALYLMNCTFDRLYTYGLLLMILSVLITIIYRSYVRIRYREFRFSLDEVNKVSIKRMFSFAGWNTFGAIAMIGRNQGVAIIMNLFYGVVANAAYGIANQINGVTSYFATTFQKALNPQLMQSEGANDRERLIKLSLISSKFSFLLLALLGVPLIIEMSYILELWLGKIPDYTLRMCQLIIILSLLYQYSVGLMSAIQAVGKIKKYFLIISLLILLNLPISYYLLKLGYPPYYCIMSFILIEVISLFSRLILCQKYTGLRCNVFLNEVIFNTLFCVLFACISTIWVKWIMDESILRLSLICIIYGIFYIISVWFWVLNKEQRTYFKQKILNLKHRIR